MDGYIIARLQPGEAEGIYAMPQVRHVAELADGNTFVAFDGKLPYLGGMILEVDPTSDFLFPMRPIQVRRVAPIAGEVEYLGLYTTGAFVRAPLADMQVSALGLDLFLALSDKPLLGVTLWTSYSESIRDKRLEAQFA